MSGTIPETLTRTMLTVHGEAGASWLRRLTATIAACERRWAIAVQPPFADLYWNYVAPATCADGTEAVLKAGIPNSELLAEIDALRVYDGHGIARLLAYDRERGILLLERLRPGTPLADVADDERATAIAADVMRQLWRPAPAAHSFPTVADWAEGMRRLRCEFDGGSGPFPPNLVERAEGLFAELIPSSAEPVLLHGDLHHWNIITAERRGWLAIDPKGVVGEPAYEVGAFLRNRLPANLSDARRLLARRVDQLAERLDFDRQRLIGWGLAQAVLSAWWGYEDEGRIWDETVNCAEALAGL